MALALIREPGSPVPGTRLGRAAAILLGACAVLAAPAAGAQPSAAAARLIDELGLEEAERPVRERPGWERPRRILVRLSDGEWLARFEEAAPGVELVAVADESEAARLAGTADAIIGFCSAEVLADAPRVRWVQTYVAGVERCAALPAMRERDILLTNMQRVAGPVIAEHAIALLFALARGLHVSVGNQSSGRWDDSVAGRMQVLAGKTLLVVGLGGIGTEVARRAHALGMKVIAVRATGRTGPAFVSYVGGPQELPALVRQADAVVNATPLTDATRGLFDARLFAAMKPTAFFVNVGRGGSVVTADLVEALQEGRIAGAGLDVTDPEPLPPEHPLWRAPNLIVTPHVASSSDLGRDATLEIARENLRRYVAGERMLSVVDLTRGY